MENIRNSIRKASQKLKNGVAAPDFWALVRAVENADTTKPRLGYAKNPADENIRFGQAPFLHFPPTDIAEIIEGGRRAGVDATVITYFFGLLGVNGPMPLEFTHYVLKRSYNYFDNTWRRFLDILHHRFLTLYCRSYAACQQAMSADREDDPVLGIIKSLTGFAPGQDHGERRERIALNSAQHFSLLVKNRWGLEDILRRTFRFNVEIKDFIPAVYDIPQAHYAVLGKEKSSVLGVNLQIGRTYMSITGKFEIRLGPLSFEEYRSFMSSGNGFSLLSETVSLYLDRPLDYSVVFSLQRGTIPPARLGFDPEKARRDPPQLGYTCWIGNLEDTELKLTIAAARLSRRIHKEKTHHG